MLGRDSPLRPCDGRHIDVSLNICPMHILGVQLLLPCVRQCNLNCHMGRFSGGHCKHAGFKTVQEEVSIIRINHSIGIEICLGIHLLQRPHCIVEDHLCITGIGIPVMVQVTIQPGGRLALLAIHRKGHMPSACPAKCNPDPQKDPG